VIEAQHLFKHFGRVAAVRDVSLKAADGRITGLLGPNGAGKSTLIRMLTTLMPPTEGTARIEGFDIVTHANEVRQCIGVIPQAMTSDLDLTATENMSIFAKLYGIARDKRKQTIATLLKAVDLEQWADKPVKMFSGGMRRRLEIARGLVHEPKLFFLDEPTTGLDPVSRVAVWEMLAKLKQERNLTILVTTHYMDEADKLCDRIAIVDHGKLAALDTPAKLKDSVPGNDTVEAEFANAPADWMDQLRKLAQAADVTQRDEMVHIASHDGPATVAALMDLARARSVQVKRVTVQGTTLDDVFLHYTGSDLRDAAKEGARLDIGHLYR